MYGASECYGEDLKECDRASHADIQGKSIPGRVISQWEVSEREACPHLVLRRVSVKGFSRR